MATKTVQVQLDEEDVQALERLAARERRSIDTVMAYAMHEFAQQQRQQEREWEEIFDRLLTRLRSRPMPDVSEEEMEADIRAAREEVWEERRTHRD